MEPNKEIGKNDDTAVEQPAKVSESLNKHSSGNNNMQQYMQPQNGGEVAINAGY